MTSSWMRIPYTDNWGDSNCCCCPSFQFRKSRLIDSLLFTQMWRHAHSCSFSPFESHKCNHTRANCRLEILRVWNWKSHTFCSLFRYICNFGSFASGFRNLVRVFLVPRAHDPSGLWQGSRALAWPDFLSMRRVFVSYSQPIRFARFDGKSVNRGLPVLD